MHVSKGGLPKGGLPPKVAGLAAIAIIVMLAVVAAGSAGAKPSRTTAGSVVFLSTQLTPVTEQQKFIDVTLKGAPVSVNFVAANAVSDMVTRINAEAQAGSGQVSLAGATVGDLEAVADQLIR